MFKHSEVVTNIAIEHYSSAHSQMVQRIAMLYQYFSLGAQLKNFKYCYLTRIILFNNIY